MNVRLDRGSDRRTRVTCPALARTQVCTMPSNRRCRAIAPIEILVPAMLASMLLLSCGITASAQGIAGAAIQGSVERTSGTTLPDVRVALIDSSTGNRRYTTSSARGLFAFENLPVGGPYAIEVKAIRFVP